MFQPLYVAATGLDATEEELLNITNNLANSKTTAFKRADAQMESLTYVQRSFQDELDRATNIVAGATIEPEFGTGVKISSMTKDFTQGVINTTSRNLDISIQGDGFLQVKMPDGSYAFTRAGSLHADNEGNIVDANGHVLEPAIVLPEGTTAIVIRTDGTVLASIDTSLDQTEVGQITLTRFSNPSGLKSVGQNLYTATEASGEPVVGSAGDAGYGTIVQYSLEASNVDVISEMMKMVMVQRLFETITKAVSTYEAMLTSLERMKA